MSTGDILHPNVTAGNVFVLSQGISEDVPGRGASWDCESISHINYICATFRHTQFLASKTPQRVSNRPSWNICDLPNSATSLCSLFHVSYCHKHTVCACSMISVTHEESEVKLLWVTPSRGFCS